jgi:hypothetical protein
LSYGVPEGWTVIEDQPASFLLQHVPDQPAGEVSAVTLVGLFAQPRIAADFESGASCGSIVEAPGVGRGVEDIVAAIIARPGLVATSPAAVTIGGYEGQMIDLHLEPSWTGGSGWRPDRRNADPPCGIGAGPAAGIGAGHTLRVILLDSPTAGPPDRRLRAETSQTTLFEDQVAAVMPIIETFQFHDPTP